MTALPLPQHSDRSTESFTSSSTPTDISPVRTLKELVARLHREQQNVNELLSSLGFALRSFKNLNQFLELTPLVASRVTDADGGALVLFKPNGQVRFQRLHCQEGRQCHDIRQALETATRQVSVQPLNSVDRMPKNMLKSYIANLDYQVSNFLGTEVQVFGTAILVNNTERGRLYVFSHDPNYHWTPTRQKLMRLVADQTAVAIANDELAVSLREKERLDRELEIGAEIQVRLLPRKCPKIPGVDVAAHCQTANRVGGDYYDFIPSNFDQRDSRSTQAGAANPQATDENWSIVIGDVMGKGVPAGLIMTMTRGMLRAEVLNRHTPAKILQHLNRVMYADLETSNRFVTLFYSEYDPATRILSYSNAAHHPPLLWQAATRSIQQLDTLGMLIGLDADTRYSEAEVQLNPGDIIVYYTDGLTDAANNKGERFDEENLQAAFEWACQNYQGSQAILDYIFEQVQQFVGPGSHNVDDMTLVVMQVQPLPKDNDDDAS
ncbi:PP2C family protein-serine/threonine phosphatase [Limnoraphis robusta]|uniref:PP2C family protein-serine/threonine phosphatase n=1 Tax=Limnoraphis robusta CCNP1315 TaxID=3110306 RepID=A0ABU5TZ34_9CYAN|nr:PP2C family protein-serine/threonine phosphatase [Limnoraphis robusta]MEA5520160.1 PP2C family protein-serine/threonine phosphatase [Limnoraphis robusta CCNP1315]MEA5543871.1 PP2C family protein-serine/threonine phosphatase [Limnoraphis robusta CCNP1324]